MQAIQPINDIKIDLSLPVLKTPMTRDAFVSQFHTAQQAMFHNQPLPRQRQLKFNDCTVSVKYFRDFINGKELSAINPTEDLLDEFLDNLTEIKGNNKHRYCQSLCNNIRNLINHFPSDILNRPLVNAQRMRYLNRHSHCSSKTKQFLDDFLKDGRKLNRKRLRDGKVLSNKCLAPRLREFLVWAASMFLKATGKACLLDVTPKDAEVFIRFYEARGRRDLAIAYLADLQPIFMNLIGKGGRDSNPIEAYNERQPTKVDDDFIMPETMEISRDLSSVNFKDFSDVRDRMLTFALYYDFCIRNGESALLKITDIVRDGGFVGITLEPEIQKGQNKPTVTLYNCFDESRRLIQAYVDLRAKMLAGRQVDAFLLSATGTPLGETGCREAVKKHCDRLGIKTRKGNTPYPHCLRHTFATINIDRIGLCLTPYYIQGRLRHADLATTIRIYVQNNPLLAKQNHIANVQRARELHDNHGINQPSASLEFNHNESVNDIVMLETEAVRMVRPLGITAKSLRDYAEPKGIIEKKSGHYFYSRSFIQDLSRNWLTKQQVMKKLRFGRSRFCVWAKTRGIEPVIIGRVSLVKATDVIEELKK